MYKHWSKKEISNLKKYYPIRRVKDLATIFPERTKATIVAKALDLKLPSAKLWQPEENEILREHFSEMKINDLLELLPKRSKTAIWAQGERLGLKRKTNKPHLKVNEDYFKRWTANMAYILGFTFADGNISKVTHNGYSDKFSFGQHKKDIDILKKIKKELAAEQSLSLSGKYIHFSIHSQTIVNDLKRLGISYRKSFRKTPTEIPNIPKKYIKDFIRGIVDGDGCITFSKGYPTISVCGRKEVMTFIRDHFLSKFEIYSKIGKRKKIQFLFYITYRTNSAKTIIKHLYNNSTLYLDRKFKLAKKAMDTKIRQRKNYTNTEKQKLQKTYKMSSKEEILSLFPSRSWDSIQQKASGMGIHKYNINNKNK